MNYEAERAMNQKRLRMDGEPGHGVVQGNGLPLNYMDNGHQIPYQPYAGAYNTHYPPPDAFAAYGPPPPGGYAPQNLSYAPPAHQNYPHHQSFPPQQPQAQLHMPQSHMGKSFQGYAPELVHKAAWAPQPHLLPPLDAQKPLDVKQLKPEIKLEPQDAHKRPHPESEMMSGDLDQPKIKIKTDIFKPDDLAHRPDVDKPHDISQKILEVPKPAEQQKDDGQPSIGVEGKSGEKPAEACKPEGSAEGTDAPRSETKAADKSEEDRKPFSSPELPKSGTPGKASTPGLEVSPKKRGRPKGSTNKPKPPGAPGARAGAPPPPAARGPGAAPRTPQAPPRPRPMGYQYAVRPFRKDFSGIQFRRRWSDDCLDSSHIPNEVYFGDVPVSTEVLFNYYDANAERERLAAQAAQIAAQKAAAAKLAAAKLQARGLISNEVTTVDSSSSDDSSGSSGSDSEDSDDVRDAPLKRGPGRPKGGAPRTPGTPGAAPGSAPGSGRRGRPPVPPELRQPGITEMKKFCKAAGIRFDYKKLVEGSLHKKQGTRRQNDGPANGRGSRRQAHAGEMQGAQTSQGRQEGAGETGQEGGQGEAQTRARGRGRRADARRHAAYDARRDGREAAAAHRDLVRRGGRHARRAPHALQAALQRQRRLRLRLGAANPRVLSLVVVGHDNTPRGALHEPLESASKGSQDCTRYATRSQFFVGVTVIV